MRMTLHWPVVAALAFCLTAARDAGAGEKVHAVSSGESASSIAEKYYGDVELGDFLLRYNGKTGTVIHENEKLKVPYCDVHRVGKGDTWSSLASRHLEKAQAHPVVAALNGFAAGDVLPVGESIVIPVVLSWRLERGDALASLAGRFYGDPNRADLLQMFNDVDDPRRLSVGETVKVPLVSIRLRKSAAAELPQKKPAPVRLAQTASQDPVKSAAAAKASAQPTSAGTPKATASKPATAKAVDVPKDPAPKPATAKAVDVPKDPAPKPATAKAADVPKDSAPKPATAKAADVPKDSAPKTATSKAKDELKAPPQPEPTVSQSSRFDMQIRDAARVYAEGDYLRARRQLESLRDRARSGGTDKEKVEIARLLAYVYVAFDMPAEACLAYRSVSELPVDTSLDADFVSPKIRDALSRCTGQRS